MPNAMLEALGTGLPCMGSNIAGIKDILQYKELMFDAQDEKTLIDKIQQLFTDQQCFDKVKNLCQERKDIFVFDWKERAFEMITGTCASLIT
jgi:glycosyltransferase involved in cell wall biosynthesis